METIGLKAEKQSDNRIVNLGAYRLVTFQREMLQNYKKVLDSQVSETLIQILRGLNPWFFLWLRLSSRK